MNGEMIKAKGLRDMDRDQQTTVFVPRKGGKGIKDERRSTTTIFRAQGTHSTWR